MRILLAICFVICAAVTRNSRAAVIEYESVVDWINDAGASTTITFEGFPDNTIITNQYASLGVLFTDGTDRIDFNPNSFPNDGVGLNGALDEINVSFSQPMFSIGVEHPGSIKFFLFWHGDMVYESDDFIHGGAGFFSGLISDDPFDAALIIDPLGDVFIDDLYFGPPVPAPPAFLLFATALARRCRGRSGMTIRCLRQYHLLSACRL